MARASIWLTKFDRDAEYTVARGLTLGGKALRPGDPLDKCLVSTRTLRCLFEQRKIAPAGTIQPRVVTAPLASAAVGIPTTEIERKVAHVGRGKFCVMQGKVRLSEMMTKEQAEALLVEMNKTQDAA